MRNQILQTVDSLDALNPAYAGQLGAGRVNAARATQAPHPVITLAGTTINGDPLGRPTPGETATLAVTLRNDWWDATGVTGTLSTTDAFVTVGQGTAGYGDLVSGASGVSSPAYTFTVAAGAGYNHAIPFTLDVTASDGAYTTTIPFTITTRSGDEHFCGTVAEDLTWTNDKTYILDCNVGIAPGYTLTIQAGTEVHFNGNYNLNVGGALIADGTAAQPIRFMPHTGGSWGRIFFDDPSADAQATASGTYLNGNLLRHVRVEGAAQGIGCANATPYLDHLTLTGGGMDCAAGSTSVWLNDNHLNGNTTFTSNASPLVGFSNTPGSAEDVAVSGNYAYVADGSSGLQIIDISNPAIPALTGSCDTPGDARGVAVSGDYAYVADGSSGLQIIDISNPAAPALTASYDTPGDAWRVAVSGDYAYVAEPNIGLQIINISNPVIPTLTSSYTNWVHAYGVTVRGDYAYMVGGTLQIINISNPVIPTLTGSCGALGYPVGVAVRGNYAYVAAVSGGLQIVDISNPAIPAPTGSCDTPGDARGVAVSGDYAYVADGSSGLQIINIGNPATPTLTASYDTLGDARRVAVSGDYAYVADGSGGLNIYPNPTYGWMSVYVHNTVFKAQVTLPDAAQVLTSTLSGGLSIGKNGQVQNNIVSGGINAGNDGTVKNNTVTGGITVGDNGTVQDNTVTGGGISVGSGSALNNTITGGGISVGSGGIARDNSIENAPGWGIQASGNATVEYNRIVGAANGIQANGGVVKGNLIANITGIGLQIGSATVEHNTFTGIGGSAIKITSGVPGLIAGNNFEFNTGAYDVENLIPKATLMTVDARNNWWGTTSGTTIRGRIWDFNDDYPLGTVLYAPTLTAPDTTAPAYVRAITLTPESPVGIQTVAFEVLFSREMDTEVVPGLGFVNPVQWTARAPMPTPRSDLAAATASNGKIYAIGGVSNTVSTSVVEEYNLATNTWQARAPMPTPRSLLAAATASNGNIYAIGGYITHSGYTAVVEEYDLATDAWQARAPMPTMRWGLAAVTTPNGKIYAIGGYSNSYTAVVEEYDPATNTWQARAPMPTPRSSLAAATAPNGKIYAIGGYSNSGYTAVVEEYDPAANTWQVRAPMPTPRSSLAAATAPNGNIYAIGGYSNSGCTAVVEEYDPATDTWQAHAPMPTMRWGLAAVTTPNGKIYAIGGDSNNGYTAMVEELTPLVAHTDFDGGYWLTSNLYRTTYDFSTLIPRGVYTLTVADAQTPETTGSGTAILPIPGGGMAIAPNSAYTFTVDYAGYINDTTAPLAPMVTACAAATPDTLSAVWSAYDPDSAIDRYQYAIGVTPEGTEVVYWTFTPLTETMRVSLTLVAGQTYYFSVKARNEGGIWSEAGSVGVAAGSDTCVGTEPASLEVDFSGTPRSGDAPLDVQFTSIVTGEVTSYAWAFGDGGTAATANSTHTYTSAGSFGVTLIVTGPGGVAQAIKPGYITVNPSPGAPTATFSANVVSGTAPLNVTFTAVISGTVEGWRWVFGDGGTAITGPVVQHTYQKPGVFDVRLTVSNTHGSYIVNQPAYITASAEEYRVYLPLVLRE